MQSQAEWLAGPTRSNGRVTVLIGLLVLVVLVAAGLALTRRTGVGADELFRRGVVRPRHVLELPPAVENQEWMSFDDAAHYLGLAERRVRAAVAAGAVVRASNCAGDVGVTRSSVERELEWRRSSTRKDRARRVAAVILSYTRY